jgi:hypothetical protein
MLYAIICYDSEAVVGSWSKEEDDAVMARIGSVTQKLAAQGKMGPSLRLMPTTAAVTLRHGRETVVIDGPFAETKEQLLGFYIVDCPNLDEAIEAAKSLFETKTHGTGSYEIRPITYFDAARLPTGEQSQTRPPRSSRG